MNNELLKSLNNEVMSKESKELKALKILDYHNDLKKYWSKEFDVVEQALQRLNKYEQILSSGRLTDKLKNGNYICGIIKGGFVDKLGKLEDIYEEGK